MQNNGKFFTFLLSHSKKSRIYIRRVEVSKKLVQNSLLSLALIVGLSSITTGIYKAYNSPSNTLFSAEVLTVKAAPAEQTAQPNSISYERPDAADAYAINSGGPYIADGSGVDDVEIEQQLRAIQTTSDPATIPAMWAHSGKINNEFGFRRNPFGGRTYEFHAGLDIDGERGDMVVAPANGTVIEAGWKGVYGNMVEIDHGNGLTTRYGHLSKIEVKQGDVVSRGQLMAYVGSTGRSTGPHLHYELRINDKPINPRRFLPPEPTRIAG
jgi:murein DD-endopeptidase MepM/ murein hydrolase activator NlpD